MSAKMGRPPIPAEDIAAWQDLYLELLAQSKSEVEINAVEGMPCWKTRWTWQQDRDFFARRSVAQKQGVEYKLKDAELKLEDTYQRALDEAASPQLVAITDKIAQHARWKASKLNKDDYGDKATVSHEGGDPDKPVAMQISWKESGDE